MATDGEKGMMVQDVEPAYGKSKEVGQRMYLSVNDRSLGLRCFLFLGAWTKSMPRIPVPFRRVE